MEQEVKLREEALARSVALNETMCKLLEDQRQTLNKVWLIILAICVCFSAAFFLEAYIHDTNYLALVQQLEDIQRRLP